MEHTVLKVLIVDDEAIVRAGLKNIIDWQALGFCICEDAVDGEEALEKLKKYNPNLVLLDIQMPNMMGTEFIQKAREDGFTGEFIILSGYSDFKYAQTAMRYDASYYFTKPVDEVELEKAVLSVREKIIHSKTMKKELTQYKTKARDMVLRDLLSGDHLEENINYQELGFVAPIYQVVIYTGYMPFSMTYSFADLLNTANQGNNLFEHIRIDHQEIILLKGNQAIARLNDCLIHYKNGTQKGSPLDSIFLTCVRTASSLVEIRNSYEDCKKLMNRRFFCVENQHVLSYEELPEFPASAPMINTEKLYHYGKEFTDCILAKNRGRLLELFEQLRIELYNSDEPIMAIKHFLIDIFLQIKDTMMNRYSYLNIPFAYNASIIEIVENKYYLYEILDYFKNQFDMMIRAISNSANDYVFQDILTYIEHNYADHLKLEGLAVIFGYNSSYLGKLFSQKMNQNFNSYLDEVRVKNSVKLLEETDMKVYEIAEKVGYNNVNYFHQKFKKIMGMSPAEYRMKNRSAEVKNK